MEWKEIKKDWPPEDIDVLTWNGIYYDVAHFCFTEGENDEIPVFISNGGFNRTDIILWSFLPNQPERLSPEASKEDAIV